jgi:hypothetical protein
MPSQIRLMFHDSLTVAKGRKMFGKLSSMKSKCIDSHLHTAAQSTRRSCF